MGDEGVAETNAIGGEPIHVRCFKPRVAGFFSVLFLHCTHGVPAMVIADDEDEVGFALGGGCESENKEIERQQGFCHVANTGWKRRIFQTDASR